MLDLKGKKVILCGICLTLDKEVAQNCWWELGGKSRDLALLLFLSPSLSSQRNGCSQPFQSHPFQSHTPPPTVTSPLPFLTCSAIVGTRFFIHKSKTQTLWTGTIFW